MIFPLVALAISIATLGLVIRNYRETKRLQRQTFADLYMAAILNSGAAYYRRRAAEARARTEEIQSRIRR